MEGAVNTDRYFELYDVKHTKEYLRQHDIVEVDQTLKNSHR